MHTKILAILLQEYRTHRMARFTVWTLAGCAAVWAARRLTHATGGILGLLGLILSVCAFAACTYYLFRTLGFIRSRLLWRLRRRLVVAYLFIAFIPILLILLLVTLGAFIINGQFAAFLVVLKLRNHFDEIEQVNRAVLHEARLTGEKSPQVMLDGIRKFYVVGLAQYAKSYPGLVVSLRLGNSTRAFLLDGTPVDEPVAIPEWAAKEEFAGIVLDNGHLALRSVERTPTPAGALTLVLSQPFTPELLDMVGEGIGPVGVVATHRVPADEPLHPGIRVQKSTGTYIENLRINSRLVPVPEPANPFDLQVYGGSSLEPILWSGEREVKADAPAIVYVSSRIARLNDRLLAEAGELSEIWVFIFKAVAIVLLIIEGVALIIGIRLTRSITGTVDKLYDATERVKAGDLSYRIQIPSNDLLSALGAAFDSMTASVQHLLLESQEKSRLQSELDIAREVQRRLFPQSAPNVPGLKLYGVCKAARSVSGDYYDFLSLDEHRVGLVLGDVSGKGISAALLMATMQSALRAQFYDSFAPGKHSIPAQLSTARIVERLNGHLYQNSPLEKYVTFFFAIYDARTRKLGYTNAGHLPPVIFRGGKIERLREGGTVVGLIPSATYEEGEVQLEPGDLMMAFTDGITEPENTYGEEFGEPRMLEVARRALHASPEMLVEEIYRSINEWTGSPELQDDMTLLLAQAVE